MTDERPDEKTLRKVLAELVRGYSLASLEGRTAYVKHFGNEDQYDLEAFHDGVFANARDRGLPTEEESMELLRAEGIWSEEDESEYSTADSYISNLEETRKNLIIPSQINEISKDIDEAQQKLDVLNVKKKSLLTDTCESYAKNKSNDYSIYLSFYSNPKCDKKFFKKT